MSTKTAINGNRRIGLAAAIAMLAVGGTAAALVSTNSLHAGTALSTPVASAQDVASNGFSQVIAQVSPAVVAIEVSREMKPLPMRGQRGNAPFEFFERFFDDDTMERFRKGVPHHGPRGPQMQPAQAIGSGFLVDGAGYIVTNDHVVADANEISVTLQDGTRYQASLVGRDSKTDLALLKIEADTALPFVSFADSETTNVGDWVVAVGNPFGLGNTVTVGIVSAEGRGIGAGPYDDFLQIDAPINRGSSGGPSFNLKGEVVGVNTAIFSPSGGNVGIGFAVPASMAEDVIGDLKVHGGIKRGWLGVQIQGISPDMAESLDLDEARGAIVAKVLPDGPAEKAALEQGDVILAVNGEAVTDSRDVARTIAGIKPGESVELTILRDGEEISVMAEVGQMAAAEQDETRPATSETSALGMHLEPLDAQARKAFKIDEGTAGVIIANVAAGSPAAAKGLAPGDVIVSVGSEDVASPDDVVAKIEEAKVKDRDAVLFLTNRRGNEFFIAIPLSRA